jgi:hypothetical protein
LERDAIYLKRHFDGEITVLCVRWYIKYKLSYRDLAATIAGPSADIMIDAYINLMRRLALSALNAPEPFFPPKPANPRPLYTVTHIGIGFSDLRRLTPRPRRSGCG